MTGSGVLRVASGCRVSDLLFALGDEPEAVVSVEGNEDARLTITKVLVGYQIEVCNR